MYAVKMTSTLVALWVISLGQARAGIIVYTDFSDWSSAQSSFKTIGNPGNTVKKATGMGSSFAYEGVTFTLESEGVLNYPQHLEGNSNPLLITSLNNSEPLEMVFLMTFPTPITGFATNLYPTDGQPLLFQFETGESITFNFFAGESSFFLGVTNSVPFGSVRVYSEDFSVALFNISYGPVAAVPEPGSLTLAGLGIIGGIIGVLRRRSQGKSEASIASSPQQCDFF